MCEIVTPVALFAGTHTMPNGMPPTSDVDLTPLLAELRLRRINSRKGPKRLRIRQEDVAKAMGVDATYVGRLESGKRSLRNVPGDQLYHFFRGYHYTPSEIEGIVSRYRLNTPPQLLESRAAETGMVVVLSEGSITRPGEPVDVQVPRYSLRGLEPQAVRERTVHAFDLATPKAQEKAPIGSQLILSDEVHPGDGGLVVVEQDGRQALAMWPLVGGWATPYRPGGPHAPLELDPARFRIVTVVVSKVEFLPIDRGAES